MYKVLPCVLKLVVQRRCIVFRQIFRLNEYSGRHFCSHVMKSILSGAEIRADQDGA